LSFDLSVVVPTYTRAEAVRRLLGALSEQSLSAERFEVIVAIDGSRDGTQELVADHTAPYSVSSIWQENSGRAAACNAGILRATAPVVVILDDDMEPAPECLEAHLVAHTGRGLRCVLGAAPIELRPDDPPVARYFQQKFDRHLRELAKPDHRFVARDFYSGNLSVERELLIEVGLFDADFRRYGNEDVDLALRLVAAGGEIVYEPRARARQRFDKGLARAVEDSQSKGQTALLLACKRPEALPELRLATYRHAGIRWRILRGLLLRLSRRSQRPLQLLLRFTLLVERTGVRLPWQYYDRLLDLFFWVGVEKGLGALEGEDAATAQRLPLH
jgi:glycosyltransferase involved in cell wall biosynthesis